MTPDVDAFHLFHSAFIGPICSVRWKDKCVFAIDKEGPFTADAAWALTNPVCQAVEWCNQLPACQK